MSGKLSERFSKLSNNSTSSNDRARDGRIQKRTATQKDKRQAKTQEKRGLVTNNAKNNNRNNNNKPIKKLDGKKPSKWSFQYFLNLKIMAKLVGKQ